jgi:hypothetical protein
MTLRRIGRSTFGAAVLVTALCALPGTAVASTTPPAPPPPPPSAAPGVLPAPGTPAPRERGRERPQVVVPQGAPETGGGRANAGTDGLDAGSITLGALGLAGAAGAACVAVSRRRTTRA